MFLPEHERLNSKRDFDTREYIYVYSIINMDSAAVKSTREGQRLKSGGKGPVPEGGKDRGKFIVEEIWCASLLS